MDCNSPPLPNLSLLNTQCTEDVGIIANVLKTVPKTPHLIGPMFGSQRQLNDALKQDLLKFVLEPNPPVEYRILDPAKNDTGYRFVVTYDSGNSRIGLQVLNPLNREGDVIVDTAVSSVRPSGPAKFLEWIVGDDITSASKLVYDGIKESIGESIFSFGNV